MMATKSESPARSEGTIAAGRKLESGKLSFPSDSNSPRHPQREANLATALVYAIEGIVVLPLSGTGKRPLASLPAAGRDLVRTWWQKHPDALPALVTGLISGLVVLNVRNGASTPPELLAALGCVDLRDLTPTITQHPNGDVQLFFWCEKPCRVRSARDFVTGIDLIADGGHVIAPGTNFPDGSAVRWIGSATDLADASPAPEVLTSGRLHGKGAVCL